MVLHAIYWQVDSGDVCSTYCICTGFLRGCRRCAPVCTCWGVLVCTVVCQGDVCRRQWSVVTGVLGSDAAYSAQDAGARRSRRSVARASLQLYDIQYENVRALIQRQRVQLIQLQEARNDARKRERTAFGSAGRTARAGEGAAARPAPHLTNVMMNHCESQKTRSTV